MLNRIWAVLGTGAPWEAARRNFPCPISSPSSIVSAIVLTADGRYGPKKEEASVTSSRRTLKTDGIAGPVTLAALVARLLPALAERSAA